MTPNSLETTRKRKDKGGERGEKKKRTPGTHNFYIGYFVSERQTSARDTPAQTPRPSGTVFKNPGRIVCMKWAKMAKRC